jgi:hypothetical protein
MSITTMPTSSTTDTDVGNVTLSPSPTSALARSDGDARLVVDASRPRQTERPTAPFRDVLAGGVSVLMSGAEVATHVLAGPVMAAAVHQASATAAVAIAPGAVGMGANAGAPMPAGTELATMQAMQRESQTFNLQLLELQEQVQQENRQFTTLSNVLRAKHDTAKAAVSNIRS